MARSHVDLLVARDACPVVCTTPAAPDACFALSVNVVAPVRVAIVAKPICVDTFAAGFREVPETRYDDPSYIAASITAVVPVSVKVATASMAHTWPDAPILPVFTMSVVPEIDLLEPRYVTALLLPTPVMTPVMVGDEIVGDEMVGVVIVGLVSVMPEGARNGANT